MRIAVLALALAACARGPECRDGSAETVAADVGKELGRDGWTDVVVEPVEDGRVLVRARRGARGLAGKVESGVAGCDGARLDLREVDLPAGPGSRFAGPAGPRTSRP